MGDFREGIVLAVSVGATAMVIILSMVFALFLIGCVEDYFDLPRWERKARRYEKKVDRLRSVIVALGFFPIPLFAKPRHNLAVSVDHYRKLADECRNRKV